MRSTKHTRTLVLGLVLGFFAGSFEPVLAPALAHRGQNDGSLCNLCKSVRSAAGNTDVTDADDVVNVTATATATLPDCDASRRGVMKTITRRTVAGVVTVAPTVGDTVGEVASITIALDFSGSQFYCDGVSNWYVE